MRPHMTVSERFWSKVDKSGDCWLWTGARYMGTGYGRFNPSSGKTEGAHRFAYRDTYGAIPPGHHIDHLCFNRACVNPAHLRAVTQQQNNQHQRGPQKRNISGYLGVHWHQQTGKWTSRVWHLGKQHYLGLFTDPAEAAEVARKKRLELFTHNDMDRAEAI